MSLFSIAVIEGKFPLFCTTVFHETVETSSCIIAILIMRTHALYQNRFLLFALLSTGVVGCFSRCTVFDDSSPLLILSLRLQWVLCSLVLWCYFNTKSVGIKCLKTIIAIHSPIILFSYSEEFHSVFIDLSRPTLSYALDYFLDSIPSFRISCVPTSICVWSYTHLCWPLTPWNHVRYHILCPLGWFWQDYIY